MISTTGKALRRERRAQLSYLARGVVTLLLGMGGIGCGMVWRQPGLLGAAATFLFGAVAASGALLTAWAVHRLLPSHSVLARTALSQAEEGETFGELRRQIDSDLASPQARFGTVIAGERWIMGEGAMKLSRVCGVFAMTQGRWHLLCMVDVDGNIQGTSMERPQLDAAMEWLRQALPLAAHGDAEAYRAFLELEPEKRWKHAPLRERKPWSTALLAFWGREGIPTSNFTPEDLEAALGKLEQGEAAGFTLLDPVERPALTVMGMFAERDEEGVRLAVAYEDESGPGRAVRRMRMEEIRRAFAKLLEDGTLPDISAWDMEPWKREAPPPYEMHVDEELFRHPAAADIEAVLTGMERGEYHSFSLMRPDRSSGGIFVDRAEEGYRVMAASPDREGVRWFETFTRRKDQVRFWLEGYFTQSVLPYLGGWEDITEQMERDTR